MAKASPKINEAEYVVVGSGSAGSALAGRLAEAGQSVILLEAGKSDEEFLVMKPGMIGSMHAEPKIKATVDWGYYSTPQEHLLNRRMPVPWGKVVGGFSSINGWSTCAATAPTTTLGRPRATPGGTPTP